MTRRRHAACDAGAVTPADLDAALAAARTGDEWGVSQLFRAIQPQLLRYLARKAPGVAEDLASATWLAVARDLPGFEGSVGDLRALLFTVARRRVADHYRTRNRRPRTVGIDDDVDPPAAPDAAELALGALSAQQAVAALVAALPADQAEVVLLRVVADLSVEEVARVMGRSTGAVRVLQHRALKRLAERFDRRAVTP